MINKMSVEYLSWDSDFFEKKIGRVNITSKDDLEVASIKGAIEGSDFDLIYLFAASDCVPAETIKVAFPDALWVDGKITYLKLLSEQGHSIDPNIESVTQTDNQLYELAIQAGQYSRFNIDTNFERDAYKKMYREWIRNSVSRSIADEVFVYAEKENKLGLITVGRKNNRMDIGLVGVDFRARGKGLASALIKRAEQFARSNDFKEIQVVTQIENKPACALYEKCGFAVESVVNIFHIWKKV